MEDDYRELLEFERSDRFDERQKAALLYTSMLVWNPEGADDAVWARLLGQQRWIKTLGIGHGEVLNLGPAGVAPEEADRAGQAEAEGAAR